MNLSQQGELLGLLETLCEGTITAQQRGCLQRLLCDDPRARGLYIEYMMFAADLRTTLSACSDHMVWPSGDPCMPVSPVEQAPWETSARKEAIRAHAERLFEQFKANEMRRQQELAYRQYRAERRKLLIGVGSMAALLVLVLYSWFFGPSPQLPEPGEAPPAPVPPPVVARIKRSLSARWLQEGLSAEPGTPFTPSSVVLTQGLVELAFDGGTEVIVQAPAELQFEDGDQMFLRGGTISARMAKGSSGFIVRTPTGTVVDYGTEFGVIVNSNGETEALVYEGEIGLRSGSDPVRSVTLRMLSEGQAGAVDTSGKIVDREFRPRQVIREMPEEGGFGIPGKRFDLADALGGGNGFGTADPNQKVNIQTGMISSVRRSSVNRAIMGSGNTPAPRLPFVDLLFVPDASAGGCLVSSAGHRFAECPNTTSQGFSYINNGGFLRHIPGVIGEQVLGGVHYGTRAEPVISMHANAGLTFDLQAIRDSLPGARIKRFTGLCGISEMAGIAKLREQGGHARHRADFWVLVDGQVRFSRRMKIQSGAESLDVELNDSDRFLSLVVTDGGDGNDFDWGVFAEPALELNENERKNGQLGV